MQGPIPNFLDNFLFIENYLPYLPTSNESEVHIRSTYHLVTLPPVRGSPPHWPPWAHFTGEERRPAARARARPRPSPCPRGTTRNLQCSKVLPALEGGHPGKERNGKCLNTWHR